MNMQMSVMAAILILQIYMLFSQNLGKAGKDVVGLSQANVQLSSEVIAQIEKKISALPKCVTAAEVDALMRKLSEREATITELLQLRDRLTRDLENKDPAAQSRQTEVDLFASQVTRMCSADKAAPIPIQREQRPGNPPRPKLKNQGP